MKTILLTFCTIILAFSSYGHNPLAARYELKIQDDRGLLTVNLSQTGLEQALVKVYGLEKINTLIETEFKEYIITYVKDHFSLDINGMGIKLGEGGIRLGNHQTDLKFIVHKIPKEIGSLKVNIDAFKENENHQTIFITSLNGIKNRVILSEKNNFRTQLALNGETMFNEPSVIKKNMLWLLIFISTLIFGIRMLKVRGEETISRQVNS